MKKKLMAAALTLPLLGGQLALASGGEANVEERIQALEAQIAQLRELLVATQASTKQNAETL